MQSINKRRFPVIPGLFAWLFSWFLILCPLAGRIIAQTQQATVIYPAVSLTATVVTQIRPFPISSEPSGTIIATFTGITGSPAGCNASMNFYSSTGTLVTQASQMAAPIAITNGSFAFRVGTNPGIAANQPLLGHFTQGAVSFGCSTFPTSGTAIFEFIPGVFPAFFYQHISSNTSTAQKTVQAQLHAITINNPGSAETLTVFDNGGCSGTVIAVISPSVAGQNFQFDTFTSTGLCIVSAGTTAGDYTVIFR
jgi:hypothetical protein